MSQSPHAYPMRSTTGGKFVDTMLYDALIDPFYNIHVVTTAENIARQFKVSREEQDEFAAYSQNKCEEARKLGKFNEEIVPVVISTQEGDIVLDKDEIPRNGVTKEDLAKLKPALMRDSSVTGGNASGISDGAAAVMLMTRKESEKRGLAPLATIKSWGQVGVDPAIMGTAPVPASKKALAKAGWSVSDLDLIELNEAFASQAIYVNRHMEWELNRVNVNGGAIALGHPFGAAGTRILTTLLYEMQRSDAKKALATLCIGGGLGIAMCVERQ
jgi:acetyl-CoA C-acetyltransferase